MELPPVDQPQCPILWTNCYSYTRSGKLSTAKKVQSSSCKHLPLVSFVNSSQFFDNQLRSWEFWHHWLTLENSACLFLSQLQFSLIVELLFSDMHPSITIYCNLPIHTFFCIIPSGGFTCRTGLPSCARAKLLRTIKWQYPRKLISNFQLAWATCLKLTVKAAFTSNISQLFSNACKLHLRDHTYTMIHCF